MQSVISVSVEQQAPLILPPDMVRNGVFRRFGAFAFVVSWSGNGRREHGDVLSDRFESRW